MAEREDGFLARWSRRKAEARAVEDRPKDAPLPSDAVPAEGDSTASGVAAPSAPQRLAEAAAPATPPPTLADVAALGRDADFSRFVAPDVDAEVRRAAMKKLFTDPHFNVMDGLDVYIDDYSKPDPIPPSMLRQMTQAKLLGLFDDEPEDGAPSLARDPGASDDPGAAPAAAANDDAPLAATEGASGAPDECPDAAVASLPGADAADAVGAAPAVARATASDPFSAAADRTTADAALADENTDLQLQPDDAARRGRAGAGPRA